MKQQEHIMQEQAAIRLRPIISYPREAKAGERYLFTIDVQLAEDSPWPYQEEEFEISFILETAPFFTHEPVGKHEPGLVLHRYGGTYGAAEYLLTASKKIVAPGKIKVTLLNGWGLPIAQVELECEVKKDAQAHRKQQATIKQRRNIATSVPSSVTLTPFTHGFSVGAMEEIYEKLLTASGWRGNHLVNRNVQLKTALTNGEQITHSYTVLRLSPSLPIAVLYRPQVEETFTREKNHVKQVAMRLAVPFAYILIADGVAEFDFTQGTSPDMTLHAELPKSSDLRERWFASLQLPNSKDDIDTLTYPYQSHQKPRYYQEAAINQGVIETLRALHDLRNRRILLILATGTGKTLIAFQILWKLKQTRRVRNILFLADRAYLLDQAQFNTFGPFNEAITRGTGKIDTAHDIVFGTYQWLAGDHNSRARYREYPSDYFDVIVIDECHRSSADETSSWRKILEHFSYAIQIGLTATPLDTKDVQTNKYYGPSVYTYSLSQGIQDGYLAPYRVHRVLIEQSLYMDENIQETTKSLQEQLVNIKPVVTLDMDIVTGTSNLMKRYSQTIATHLANYLQQTSIHDKTIVFCVDNAHADIMRLELENACASWMRSGDIVRIVDDDGAEGKRALSLFCTPKERQPVIVTTSRLLTTGVDVPTCKNIVLARGVGSIVEFKQIIGRGTRLFPPEKTWFTIIDYAGAIKHFFDRNFDGDPQLIESEELIVSGVVNSTEISPNANVTQRKDSSLQIENEKSDNTDSYPETHGSDHLSKEALDNFPSPDNFPGYDKEREENREALRKANTTYLISEKKNGGRFIVRGVIFYELAPDGRTLREGTLSDFAHWELQDIAETPEELQERWLIKTQRQEIIEHVGEVLDRLILPFELTNVDYFDCLLYTLFQIPTITREERVNRFRTQYGEFFQRFEHNSLATQILHEILNKYAKGEITDVSDVEVLRIPPLSRLGTPMELARAFRENIPIDDSKTETELQETDEHAILDNAPRKNTISSVLKELERLLYSVS